MSLLIMDILNIVREYIDTLNKYNAMEPEDILEKADDGILPISEAIIIYNRLKDIEEMYPYIKRMNKRGVT